MVWDYYYKGHSLFRGVQVRFNENIYQIHFYLKMEICHKVMQNGLCRYIIFLISKQQLK